MFLVLETNVLTWLNYFPKKKILMINYFIEIKNRIILVFIAYFLLFTCFYYYSDFLLILSIFLNKEIAINNILNYFIFTSISDLFFIYLKLTVSFSNYVIFLITFYHFICFLKPGLYKKEFFYLKFYLKLNLVSNIFFFFFFNNVILPFISHFFVNVYLNKNEYINLFFEANICEYFIFYKKIYFNFFMNFQSIILIFLVINYFNFNIKIYKKIRKIIYLILLLISTLITPPEIINLLLCYFVMIVLFEINLFLIIFKNKLINQVNN